MCQNTFSRARTRVTSVTEHWRAVRRGSRPWGRNRRRRKIETAAVEGEVAEEEGEEDKKIKTVLKLHLNVVDSILAELFRFIRKNNITTTNELICVVQN